MIPRPRTKTENPSSVYVPISNDVLEVKEQKSITGLIRYKDSTNGALSFLAHETRYKVQNDSRVIPDANLKGVWKITNVWNGVFVIDCIIYMAGYPDQFGNMRTINDFEELEWSIDNDEIQSKSS
jgi:hypothetical protein